MRQLFALFVLFFSVIVTLAQPARPLNQIADSILALQNPEYPVRFVVLGDNRRQDTLPQTNPIYEEIMWEIAALKPDLVLNVGDLVYNGQIGQYDAFYGFLASWMDSTEIPSYSLPGNHEFNGGRFQNYYDYVDPRLDYYFDYGDLRFICMNNVQHPGNMQHIVLPDQLDSLHSWLSSTNGYKFVLEHVPITRSGHYSGLSIPGYQAFQNYLVMDSATASFAGHFHDYYRDLLDGIYHVISGGGGANLMGIYDPPINYPGHHFVLVTADACGNVLLEMYRKDYGHDSIAALYDFFIKGSSIFDVQDSIVHSSCNGVAAGEIFLSPKGGQPPYSYAWSNGSSSQSQSTLLAGTYYVTITDSQSCTFKKEFVIEESPEIILNGQIRKDVSCAFGNDGMLSINILGGHPPYAYQWSNGKSGHIIDSLTAGIYSVTVTDSLLCTKIFSFTVEEPNPIIPQIQIWPDTNDQCLGKIKITALGGNSPYTISWDQIIPANIWEFDSLCVGTLYYTILDSTLCQTDGSISIQSVYTSINKFGNSAFKVYISKGNLIIRGTEIVHGDYVFELINLKGVQIFKENRKGKQSLNESISIDKYAQGIYIMKIHDPKGKVYNYKVLIP